MKKEEEKKKPAHSDTCLRFPIEKKQGESRDADVPLKSEEVERREAERLRRD